MAASPSPQESAERVTPKDGPLSLPSPELLARSIRCYWEARDRADPAELRQHLELIGDTVRQVGGRQMLMRVLGLASNRGLGRPRNDELRALLMEAWEPYLSWRSVASMGDGD